MRERGRWSRGVRVLAAVMSVVVLLAACSDDDEPEATADSSADGATAAADAVTSESEPEPTSSTVAEIDPADLEGEELEAYVAGRYEAYWEAYDAARAAPTLTPSTDFPLLTDLAAGEQLDVSFASLIELAEKGEAVREPESPAIAGVDAGAEHRVRIDLIDGAVAELTGCVVNDDVRLVVGSGAVVRDAVSTVMSEATMAVTDGDWKLIRSRAVDIADGVAGCWLTDDAEFPY